MITIVIPTYNYSLLLANAIDSALSQTRKADKIIVVDDASQDQAIAEYVSYKYGIPFIGRKNNYGHHSNFQDILDHIVTTKYMMFLTADNYLVPDFLLETEKKIKEGYDAVGTQTFIVGEYAELMYKQRSGGWLDRVGGIDVWKWNKSEIIENCWLHGSSLFNVETARRAKGFTGTTAPDWNLWKNMAKINAKFDIVEKPLLFYRQHRFNHYQITYENARLAEKNQ